MRMLSQISETALVEGEAGASSWYPALLAFPFLTLTGHERILQLQGMWFENHRLKRS